MKKSLLIVLSAIWVLGTGPAAASTDPVADCTLKVTATSSIGNVLCPSGSTVLTANPTGGTGTAAYTWKKGSQMVGSAKTYEATTAGSYTVTVKQGGCTATSDSLKLTVGTIPVIGAIRGDTLICANKDIVLTTSATNGTAPYTYEWKREGVVLPGLTANSITISLAGNYSVSVKDAKGCVSASQATFTVGAPKLFITTQGRGQLCSGDNLGVKLIVFSMEGFVADSYSWKKDGKAVGTGPAFQATSTGTYTLEITDTKGCVAVSGNSAKVEQATSPVANAGPGATLTGTETYNLANVTTAKSGTTPYTYAWTTDPAIGKTYSEAQPQIGPFKASTAVTLTVTDAKGCTATNTAQVVYNPCKISVAVSGSEYFCEGIKATLTATVKDTLGKVTYKWSSGETTRGVNFTTAGNYSVTVTDTKGCSVTQSIAVEQKGTPTVQINGDNYYCRGGGALLKATASGGQAPLRYQWRKGTAAISGGTASQYNVSAEGSYSVVVKDTLGCTKESASVTITERGTDITATLTAAGKTFVQEPDTVVLNASTGTNYAYVWTRNGQVISGATKARYVARSSAATGSYVVIIVKEGCSVPSPSVQVTIESPTAVEPSSPEVITKVYPNPSSGRAVLELTLPNPSAATLVLQGLNGTRLDTQQKAPAKSHRFEVDLTTSPDGLYLWRIDTGNGWVRGKLLKTSTGY
ncbi:T9SS type A sorting domain-containing protein [Siphonobacter aquaeclarae]|uniref:Por secretion system C-terminal sorting domain-containing protein n=1 Tax=Siphonobacter aquaeclarae TaxID=563176 RepID=A0A1G9N8N1_9BACT|nr:T9SS type A sorting domain-containing protein [Siphonobacter aquaeclarae]SDL82753.1 Por secretion system C-terminal sorting domain-containing protein [Siphonobacter aquaeclarae]